jgi:RimJ/RimL family protein N-acetyltransferase
MPPIVRPARPADLDQLAQMGAALARFHFSLDERRFLPVGPGFAEGYRAWFAREIKKRDVCMRVVDDEGGERIVGYVYGRLQDVDWADLLEAHAALIDVWVEPDARKRGVAEALVRSFCDWAKDKAPRVVLSTATQNAAAQALFRKLGFRSTMIEMTRESDA